MQLPSNYLAGIIIFDPHFQNLLKIPKIPVRCLQQGKKQKIQQGTYVAGIFLLDFTC
jgi:hypothetical protein